MNKKAIRNLILAKIFSFFTVIITKISVVIMILIFLIWLISVASWVLIAIYAILNLAFKPIIPYNRERVYFENFIVSDKNNLFKRYKKEKKEWDIYNYLIRYYRDVKKKNKDYDQLIYWRQIEDLLKELSEVYILKNWISWKYKLTKMKSDTIRLISIIEEDDKIKPINLFNPFLLKDAWIFIEKEKKWHYDLQRWRYDVYFNVKNDIKYIWSICKDDIFLRNKKYTYLWKTWYFNLAMPKDRKPNDPKKSFVEEYIEENRSLMNAYFRTLDSIYKDIDKDKWPKKITICNYDPVKMSNYILDPSKKEAKFERYNLYGLVCFEISNVYSELKEEDSWVTSSFLTKIWYSPDITVSLRVYELNFFLTKKMFKNEELKKRFEKAYEKKIKQNRKYVKFLFYHKLPYWDLLEVWWNIKFEFKTDRHWFIFTWKKEWYTERMSNFRLLIDDWRRRTMKKWFFQPIIRENIYFWYLNILLFWELKPNIEDMIKQARKKPNFLINYWSLKDKDYYNYHIRWILKDLEERKKRELEINWVEKEEIEKINYTDINFFIKWSIIVDEEKASVLKDLFDSKIINIKNEHTKCIIRNLPNYSISFADSYREMLIVWINPIYTFFQKPKKISNSDIYISEYFKTEYENIDKLFDFERIKDPKEKLTELLDSDYLEKKLEEDRMFAVNWYWFLFNNEQEKDRIRSMIQNLIIKYYEIKSKEEDYLYDLSYNLLTANNKSSFVKQCIIDNLLHINNKDSLDINRDSELIKQEIYKILKTKAWTFYHSNAVKYYFSKAVNSLLYTVLWSEEALNEIIDAERKKCINWITNTYSLVSSFVELRDNLYDLVEFKETKQVKHFTVLNWLIREDYASNLFDFLKNIESPEDFLMDDYFIIKWINILDEEYKDKYWDSLEIWYHEFWEVTEKFIKKIDWIDCIELLKKEKIDVNQSNISICERWKKAILKYLKSWVSLSQAKRYLTWLIKEKKENYLYAIFNNYWLPWQCTRYVQWRYPEINFAWNAKERCDNARRKWWDVIYNSEKVWNWAVIIRDWGKYWHVAIVEDVYKDKWKILIKEMNWKWEFIESDRIAPIKSSHFKCYIKIR